MVASSEFWDDGQIIEKVQTVPISRLEPREFLNDEIYFEYYLRFKKKTEEAQARARAAKEQALRQNAAVQPPSAAPAPSSASQEPAPAPAKKRNRGALVISETFVGDSFPILNLTTMPPIKYEVIHDSEGLKKAVAALSKEKIIAVDTETTGLDPYTAKLILVQVASPQICYIMDHQKLDIGLMKQVLEDERIIKILQNAKFDYEMLLVQAGIELNNVYDTMLAERLLTAGLKTEVNLAALTKKYLNEIMDKSVRKTFYGATANHGPLTPQQLEYAAKDALALFPIYTKQLIDLKEKKLLAVADLEFKCVMAVADLELAGCKLDTVKWRQILAGVTIKRDEARNAVMELLPNGKARQVSMFGGDEYLINLNSGSQIKAEFERMGIKLEDTSEATLSKFSDNVAIKKLLEYRSHEKTLGTFGEGLLAQINPKTNRIHPDFIQYGADTGRFSCSNPNVQQIPATSDFRACFIPEEGYKLVTCDYSQCELRVLAELSGDEAFLGAFKSGGDLHILAASQMFNIPPEEVTKSQRGQAKAINFGLAYGMGPQGLALRIDKTVEESRELISAYFRAFSGVQQWLDKAGRDSVRLGYSPTPLGRKRFYHKPTSDDPDFRKKMSEIERQGKNAPIQGCVSGSTRIFEKNSGYVKIEQLVGQAVTVWDGEQFADAGIVFSGQKQLIKVHSVGGHYIECSPEHRFLMADKTWKRAEELKPQDCIVLTNEIDESWEIASKEPDPKLSLPELMVRTPESIWRNSKFLAAYLRGIFDRMGKVHSYGVTLTFAQWQGRLTWIKEIQQALLLFGIGSRINVTDEKVTVTVPSRETYLLKSKIGYKLAGGKIPKNSGKLRSEEIATIEITDTFVDMYDVVNSATERFMANGIVVHNCNADMTKMALIFIRNELKAKKYDARMVNTVHDEIVVEVIESQAQEVCEMVEAAMIRAGREILKEVPIVADAKIGDYWSK